MEIKDELTKIDWVDFYNVSGLQISEEEGNVPGGGTAVTALQTAQHTEVAPTG